MAALIAVVMGGCSRQEQLSVLMHNRTGGHMHNFVLDYGSGTVTYQIFSDGYTFREQVTVKEPYQLRLTYFDSAGRRVDQPIDWTVEPEHNGGELEFEFLPGGQVDVDYLMFAPTQPTNDRSTNLAEARKRFDALRIGMSAQEASWVLGHEPRDDARYSWSSDFGWSLKPGCAAVGVDLLEGKVARVTLSEPCHSSDPVTLATKGMWEEEWSGPRPAPAP